MENSIDIKVLHLIISKSRDATPIAAKMLQSPETTMTLQYYGQAILIALIDKKADFTAKERELLASEMPAESGNETRSVVWQLRLTELERLELQRRADAEGVSMSEYARRRLFAQESETTLD
ncbi:MAG: plasmid mobilization protein [Anaerolineae bacterium]